jgi:septal ring factor EnvC (AmiA/AmiB activator)
MPAKTSKKTARPKKPVARKPARPAPPRYTVNGAPDDAKARVLELQAELDMTRRDTALTQREKDESLQGANARIAFLEKQLEDKPARAGELEQSMRELQARLTTRQAELEASRAEAHKLRESAGRTRGNGEPGKLRCPRCGASMAEYQQDSIFGRR